MNVTAPDTTHFFERLAARGREPMLGSTSGTLRFDVTEGGSVEPWYITVRKGDVDVSHSDASADAILRVDKELLAAMIAGRVNAMTAVLRGELEPQGDFGLLISFQRVFAAHTEPGRA